LFDHPMATDSDLQAAAVSANEGIGAATLGVGGGGHIPIFNFYRCVVPTRRKARRVGQPFSWCCWEFKFGWVGRSPVIHNVMHKPSIHAVVA
jgi:hypothetical protein